MVVETLGRQRVQRRQRRTLDTGLRNQPGQWPARTGAGVSPECARDRQRLVVTGTGNLRRRPDFADRVRPDRRERVRQRGIDLDPIRGNVIRASLTNPGPRLAAGPRIGRRNVIGGSEGGRPPALAEMVSEPTRSDLGSAVIVKARTWRCARLCADAGATIGARKSTRRTDSARRTDRATLRGEIERLRSADADGGSLRWCRR